MPKILIVEDDDILGGLLLEILKKNLYNVRLSRDGLDGLQQIKKFKPDLVLLDISMPRMNGYEVLKAKAKDATIRDIPVIIISNSGEPVEIKKILPLGVADYLVKVQLTPGEVLQKVNDQFAHINLNAAFPISSTSSSTLKGKKILWAEDDDFLVGLIARKLTKEKSNLIISKRGSEVVPLAEKEAPDIIMLDFLMPELNGLEILTSLKANEKTKNIPVIMFSNISEESKAAECRKLGAVSFFVKANTNLDEIVNEIKSTIFHSPN